MHTHTGPLKCLRCIEQITKQYYIYKETKLKKTLQIGQNEMGVFLLDSKVIFSGITNSFLLKYFNHCRETGVMSQMSHSLIFRAILFRKTCDV